MNEEIETTPWHLFYTSEGWVEAGELSVGDVIVSLGSVIIVDATQTMYDLTIEEVHTFNDELRMMLEEAGFQIVIRTNSQGIYKLMIYTIIEPPIYIQHRKMSSNEAKYFYDWFIASIPNRLDILSIAIENF